MQRKYRMLVLFVLIAVTVFVLLAALVEAQDDEPAPIPASLYERFLETHTNALEECAAGERPQFLCDLISLEEFQALWQPFDEGPFYNPPDPAPAPGDNTDTSPPAGQAMSGPEIITVSEAATAYWYAAE